MIYFELFYTFFLIGLFTFGGGYAMIPMIQDKVVSKGWISNSTLMDFIAISEATPGPFAINISTFVGKEVGGPLGSLLATIGVILPSLIIILIIAIIMEKFIKNKYVKGGLEGVKPIVISLILSTTIVLLIKLVAFKGQEITQNNFSFDSKILTLFIELFALCIIYKMKIKKNPHPLMVLLISGIMGLILFI